MSIGIYKYQNKINGKIYIGQSKNIENRKAAHTTRTFNNSNWNTEYNSIIHQAIRKYGIDNFDFEIIEECLISKLDEKEIYWIDYYNSYYNGYNITKGGKSGSYFLYNDTIIEKVVDLLKNTELTHSEISNITGLENSYISNIRNGKYRVLNSEVYPLRPLNKIYSKEKYCCMECGIEINKDTKTNLCQECYKKSTRKVERPTAIELAEEVVVNGFSATGRKYNVSDTAIKKWCISYGIGRLKSEVAAWYIQNKNSEK